MDTMNLQMSFSQFALSKFEGYVKNNKKYLGVRKKLRSAHIFIPYEEYISCAILVSLIVAFLGLMLGVLIGIIVVTKVHFPTLVFADPNVANFVGIFTPYKKYTTIAIISGALFLILGTMVYSAFMAYPSFKNSMRKVKIDTMLPHALMYMYSLSRGETNIVEIIRSVAVLPNIYGEVSNEFAMALRDMELLGIDFMQALRNVQKETPSENFNDFLGNLITMIDNGGDITDFFSIQIDNYKLKKKSEHTMFLDLLGMVAECYVTGFIAGPLFIIIVAVTLGAMKSSMTLLLMGMTYVVLPFGSIAFIFLIDIMLPKDEQEVGLLKLHKVKEFSGMRIKDGVVGSEEDNHEKKLFAEYDMSKKKMRMENILKDPLRALFEEPELSLYISVPIGMMVILIPTLMNWKIFLSGYVPASEYITNYVFLGVMITIIPYVIFFESKHRKIWKIESSIPQFLKHLSIVNETGLSLAESLRVMLRTERGTLRIHIERIYTDIVWGASTMDAFTRFANKIRLSSLSRVVALITKASETSGDIRQVLDIAAADSNMNIQLRKDKSTNMFIYVIVIYISFLVFLYIIYTLTNTFLPQMAKAADMGATMFIKNFSLEFNKVYFYHTALIQAFFSGIMAGVLGEGDYRLGLKHSVIMMTIAFVLFKLFISV